MKKFILLSITALVVIFLFFLIIKPSFTGQVIEEKVKLGYCPTMQEDVIKIAKENNDELIDLGSASEVLYELKRGNLDKAIIGRKAKLTEINPNVEEVILKSGYTLVSNKKGFVDYSELNSLEIYSYLDSDNFVFGIKKISKEEVLEKVNEGKVVLISWEDWKDSFELVVVMEGNEKVKEFRGVFLYEN